MDLKMHNVWDVKDLNEFKSQLLENVFIKKEVPDEIRAQLTVIEKLMIHCFYEYDFIDVAMLQAIITLEKALKLRYEELGNTLTKKTSFEDLINWALKNNLFEDPNPAIYHGLREIRNKNVHHTQPGKGGLIYLKGVYRIFDYINDLYEQVDLRTKRLIECEKLSNDFENKFANGLIFNEGDKKWIGYKVVPSFINNKKTVPELTLSISRIFDPNKYSSINGKPDNCLVLTITDWRFEEDTFKGKNLKNNTSFTISVIKDIVNINKYENWKIDCEKQGNLSLWYFNSYEKHGYIEKLRSLYRVN